MQEQSSLANLPALALIFAVISNGASFYLKL